LPVSAQGGPLAIESRLPGWRLQNAVFGRQVLILQQQFLVDQIR
jgi:hypothetical protein